MRVSDCGGDPKVHSGLLKAWNDRQYWPDAVQSQFSEFKLYEISQFIAGAFAAYRRKHYGEIVWVKELDSFTLEEKERFPLAALDVSFKIEESHDTDPSGETGQALAARWMECDREPDGQRSPQCKNSLRVPVALDRWLAGAHPSEDEIAQHGKEW